MPIRISTTSDVTSAGTSVTTSSSIAADGGRPSPAWPPTEVSSRWNGTLARIRHDARGHAAGQRQQRHRSDQVRPRHVADRRVCRASDQRTGREVAAERRPARSTDSSHLATESRKPRIRSTRASANTLSATVSMASTAAGSTPVRRVVSTSRNSTGIDHDPVDQRHQHHVPAGPQHQGVRVPGAVTAGHHGDPLPTRQRSGVDGLVRQVGRYLGDHRRADSDQRGQVTDPVSGLTDRRHQRSFPDGRPR